MTISRRKKVLGRLIDRMGGRAELSTDRGRHVSDHSSRKLTRKQKRHSGRITPCIPSPTMKYDEIKENALEPEVFYDDWMNYRDGMRSYWDKEETERKKKDKLNTKILKFKRKFRRKNAEIKDKS